MTSTQANKEAWPQEAVVHVFFTEQNAWPQVTVDHALEHWTNLSQK